MLAFSNRPSARAILRTKSSGREYLSVRTRCFSMYFPIAGGSSTFLLEGKGSQARVWYNVPVGWYSIVFLENASFWFVLASSRRDPFVPIHGMSYPRGDTFLNNVPAHPVSPVCPRSVADAYTHTLSAPDRRHVRDDDGRIGFIME